uniref:Uncharacterized protein n=1 Tax=Anas platyrhynchos TaxID=8839 RepID=A0A8B9T0J4_ANAPL
MGCSSGHNAPIKDPSAAHPEVLGVHVQLVTVKFAQLSKALLDVVQHFLAMGADHGVASDEKNLWVQGASGTTIGHIDLAPEAGDELLLLGCPVHHGAEQKGLLEDASPSLHPVSSVSQTRHPQGQSVPPHAGGKLGLGCAVPSLMPISSACPPGSGKYNINFMSDFTCLVTAWH